MLKGIGTDTASISRIRKMTDTLSEGALSRLFTEAELKASRERHDPAEYLAARFAAKEAVFKAVAHLTPSKTFDLRLVETMNDETGCPYIAVSDRLREVLASAGVASVMISITTEADTATAIAAAIGPADPAGPAGS